MKPEWKNIRMNIDGAYLDDVKLWVYCMGKEVLGRILQEHESSKFRWVSHEDKSFGFSKSLKYAMKKIENQK